jgi:hypothetical protein
MPTNAEVRAAADVLWEAAREWREANPECTENVVHRIVVEGRDTGKVYREILWTANGSVPLATREGSSE